MLHYLKQPDSHTSHNIVHYTLIEYRYYRYIAYSDPNALPYAHP
jgi:hypothetical protein